MKPLTLSDLAARHPGLTKAIGDSYSEAAAVCLCRHHSPPTQMEVDYDGTSTQHEVGWTTPDDRTKRAWANEIDATEAGAYGVSLAAVEAEKGLVAIMRAETLTGADYYVAPEGSNPSDLENSFRLEVSGTDNGNKPAIQQRLKTKVKQAAAGSSNLPAIAAVVGFRELTVVISNVDNAP